MTDVMTETDKRFLRLAYDEALGGYDEGLSLIHI